MESDDLSRRSLLQAIGATFGAAARHWAGPKIAQAAHEAHAAAQVAGEAKISFLNAAEAADIDARFAKRGEI
jgi:hypothetical protein